MPAAAQSAAVRHRLFACEQFQRQRAPIYRDISDLIAKQRYLSRARRHRLLALRKGYDLPPLMLQRERASQAARLRARHGSERERRELGRAADAALYRKSRTCCRRICSGLLDDRSLWGAQGPEAGAVPFDVGQLRARFADAAKSHFDIAREGRRDAPQGASLEPVVLSAVLDRRLMVRTARRLPLFSASTA